MRPLGRISSLLQPVSSHVSSLSRCPNDSSTFIKFLQLDMYKPFKFGALGRISSLLQPLRSHLSSLSRCPNDSSTFIKFLQPDTYKSFKFGAHNKEGNFVTNLHPLRFIFFKFPNVRSYRKEKKKFKEIKIHHFKKKKNSKFIYTNTHTCFNSFSNIIRLFGIFSTARL